MSSEDMRTQTAAEMDAKTDAGTSAEVGAGAAAATKAEATADTNADSVAGTSAEAAAGEHARPQRHKVKGALQMVAGAALAAVGVPMMVLPGPGVAALAGGAALISKGQRNYTGRIASPLEAKLDEAADTLGSAAKDQASRAAEAAARQAPVVAEAAARTALKGAGLALTGAGKAVETGGHLAAKGCFALAGTLRKHADKQGDKHAAGTAE